MFHGIEFHHFHNENDDAKEIMPGSISATRFGEIIEKLRRTYRIHNPAVWIEKASKKKLEANDICFTFDDNIQSQYRVAKEVLDAFDIKVFFFIYTGMFHNELPRLEIYRYFRTRFFDNFNHFFSDFLEYLARLTDFDVQKELERFPEDYLRQFDFYSRNERQFRFLRDKLLGEESYTRIMDQLVSTKTSLKELAENNIWMSPAQIFRLSQVEHHIGLHSVGHATDLGRRSDQEQEREYRKNKDDLEKLTGRPVTSVSYPSGSYNQYTLSLMKEMGVIVGFKTDMTKGFETCLDIPRRSIGMLVNNLWP